MTAFRDLDTDDFCVGTVTVVTTNDLLVTGQILGDEDRSDSKDNKGGKKSKNKVEVEIEEEEFIAIRLTAPLLAIPGSGDPPVEQPYYVAGDIIRINESQIVTVGPSHV